MNHLIVSPSYRRVTKTKVDKYLGDMVTFAVHEEEAEDYSRVYPTNEIMIIPDDLKGNMAKVRNFIRMKAKPHKHLVMVDDDLQGIGYYDKGKQHLLTPEELDRFIQIGFRMCEELGTTLWGLNVQSDPKFYHLPTPFSLISPVLAPFTAQIINDGGLQYDEDIYFKEDYDFFLQVVHKYHRVLRFNKYHYIVDHIHDTGGCASYRTKIKERKHNKMLQSKWGTKVVQIRDNSINPIVRVPIPGV